MKKNDQLTLCLFNFLLIFFTNIMKKVVMCIAKNTQIKYKFGTTDYDPFQFIPFM